MLKTCKNCNGTGWRRLGKTSLEVQCKICHGTGKLDIPPGKKICVTCSGLGVSYKTSPNGSTVVDVCTTCAGTGMMDDVQ